MSRVSAVEGGERVCTYGDVVRQADGGQWALPQILSIQDREVCGGGGRSEHRREQPAIIFSAALRPGHKDGLLAEAVLPGGPALHLRLACYLARRHGDLQDVLKARKPSTACLHTSPVLLLLQRIIAAVLLTAHGMSIGNERGQQMCAASCRLTDFDHTKATQQNFGISVYCKGAAHLWRAPIAGLGDAAALKVGVPVRPPNHGLRHARHFQCLSLSHS